MESPESIFFTFTIKHSKLTEEEVPILVKTLQMPNIVFWPCSGTGGGTKSDDFLEKSQRVKRVLFYCINDDEYTEERYGECQDGDLPQQACLSDALWWTGT